MVGTGMLVQFGDVGDVGLGKCWEFGLFLVDFLGFLMYKFITHI